LLNITNFFKLSVFDDYKLVRLLYSIINVYMVFQQLQTRKHSRCSTECKPAPAT